MKQEILVCDGIKPEDRDQIHKHRTLYFVHFKSGLINTRTLRIETTQADLCVTVAQLSFVSCDHVNVCMLRFCAIRKRMSPVSLSVVAGIARTSPLLAVAWYTMAPRVECLFPLVGTQQRWLRYASARCSWNAPTAWKTSLAGEGGHQRETAQAIAALPGNLSLAQTATANAQACGARGLDERAEASTGRVVRVEHALSAACSSAVRLQW